MLEDAPVNTGDAPVMILLGPDEWSVLCGTPGCETTLADVAWIDINYNMATNVAESQGSAPSLMDLPPPHLRRYRLGVMFPFEWKFTKETNTWELEGTRPAERGAPVGKSLRVVRGNWNTAELGQLGSPPLLLRCWECGTIQGVAPLRRKGSPSPGKSPEAGAKPGSPVQESGPGARSSFGGVLGRRPGRRSY